jgi:hypothetical protein
MESEYMALSDTSREAIVRSLLFDELRILTGIPLLFSDNQAALTIVQHPVYHQRAKHIDIRYHFIRNAHQADQVIINYVPTGNQLADILTKALGPQLHQRCIQAMNIK